MYNEGYIAEYKGLNIYMTNEETFEEMEVKNNDIAYAIEKDGDYILVFRDRIIGSMDGRTKHLTFWNFDMNGNFDGAGDFENLRFSNLKDREVAYINAREDIDSVGEGIALSMETDAFLLDIPEEELEEVGDITEIEDLLEESSGE